MIRSRLSLLLLLGLPALAGVAGCPDTPPPPSGNLARPSGLAYVLRSVPPAVKTGVDLTVTGTVADLFIADAEAPGIRVLQWKRVLATNGSAADNYSFVPAVNQFFKLIIPVNGFPSRLVATRDKQRLLVLTPKTLEVIAAGQVGFGLTVTETSTNWVNRGKLALSSDTLGVPALGPLAVPVDLAVIPTPGTSDRVAVLFDQVNPVGGLLVLFTVVADSGAFKATQVESLPVGGAPRRLSLRTVLPSGLLVNSGTERFASLVELDLSAADGAKLLTGKSTPLDAGGPTVAVVDAGNAGAVGLRLDRASAAIFDLVSGALVRSSRNIPSPYVAPDPFSEADQLGRVELFPTPPVDATHGRLDMLPDGTRPGVPVNEFAATDLNIEPGESKPKGDVVVIAHSNGETSFLLGNPLRLSITSTETVIWLQRVLPGDDLLVDECPVENSEPVSCEIRVGSGQKPQTCRASSDTIGPSGTPLPVVDPSAASFGRPLTVRASYRGDLASGRSGFLGLRSVLSSSEAQSLLSMAGLEPTSVPGVGGPYSLFELTDQDRQSFEHQRLAPGDLARLRCGASAAASNGAVIGVGGDRVQLVFDASEATSALLSCNGLVRYELFPSGEEMVVSELGPIGDVVSVFERAAVTRTGSVGRAAALNSVLHVSISSARGFHCETAAGRKPCNPGGLGDCLQDELCRSSTMAGCAGTCCQTGSVMGDACQGRGEDRRCSGADFRLTWFRSNVLDSTTSSFVPTLPDQVVFAPELEGWFISYPGARGLLMTTVTGETGFRGTPFQ